MKFFIKFMLFKKYKSVEEILKIVKMIKSSENKKGAFILSSYENINKIIEKSKMDYFANLRNEIIHDGKFIDYNVSYSYCKKIYDFINDILQVLNSVYTGEDCVELDFAYQEHFAKSNPEIEHIMAIASPSILNRIGVKDNETFDEKYETFKNTKEYTYNNPLKNINRENNL